MKIKNIISAIKNHEVKKKIKIKILHKKISKYTDIEYLNKLGNIIFDYKFDCQNPKTFNEKLNWLKLYDQKDIYTTMVDKYAAKEYINNVVGQEVTIPTLAVFDTAESLDISDLPNSFVLKVTHDSGGIIICKDKNTFDLPKVRKMLKKMLSKNYYTQTKEWPYKNVQPRIIAEPYMVDESGYELKDYKFFCLNGKVEYIEVDFNRFIEHKLNPYDRNWQPLNFCDKSKNDYSANISRPIKLDEMINVAEKLSEKMSFLRVDMYSIKDKFYVGELTLYPGSGFIEFNPQNVDFELGKKLKLYEE